MKEFFIIAFPVISTIFIGFWVAFVHVLAGPDHLAAVAPIVLETKKKYWIVGFLWGLGHLLGMLLIGILYLFFEKNIAIEKISEHSEQLVGVILILLGIWSFFRIYFDKKKDTHYPKGASDSVHDHVDGKHKDQKQWASFGVGIIHGFAGVAHFILLLPVLGFSFNQALVYMIGFALGTVFAMTFFALLVGKLTIFSRNNQKTNVFTMIRFISGLISICIGIYWMM